MTERPILFSGEMVRAILDGRKTQTRRVVARLNSTTGAGYRFDDLDLGRAYSDGHHGQPIGTYLHAPVVRGECAEDGVWDRIYPRIAPDSDWDQAADPAKGYTPPASRLWVREAFVGAGNLGILYAADCPRGTESGVEGGWRPSIFMPRWASRLTLEITEVRVQRVQEISRGDAMEEGCPFANMADGPDPRDWFRDLWDSLNAKRGHGWDTNPWVWAITFRAERGPDAGGEG